MDRAIKKCSLVLCALVASKIAVADVDCAPTLVEHIQIEHHYIYVKLAGQNWHLLGSLNTVGTKERYSALLAAQMSGKKVTLRYPDGYDCIAYNLSTEAVMVRTHND